jgi:hypothetical protein
MVVYRSLANVIGQWKVVYLSLSCHRPMDGSLPVAYICHRPMDGSISVSYTCHRPMDGSLPVSEYVKDRWMVVYRSLTHVKGRRMVHVVYRSLTHVIGR